MPRVVQLHEPSIKFDLDSQPFVEPGRYTVVYVKHNYMKMFRGQTKLAIAFRIVDFGDYFDTTLHRYYNVMKNNRSYRSSRGSDLTREMCDLFGKKSVRLGTPWELLSDALIQAEVRKVMVDVRQRELSDENQYSVIGRLIKTIS